MKLFCGLLGLREIQMYKCYMMHIILLLVVIGILPAFIASCIVLNLDVQYHWECPRKYTYLYHMMYVGWNRCLLHICTLLNIKYSWEFVKLRKGVS